MNRFMQAGHLILRHGCHLRLQSSKAKDNDSHSHRYHTIQLGDGLAHQTDRWSKNVPSIKNNHSADPHHIAIPE
jgi:hypothetical protein